VFSEKVSLVLCYALLREEPFANNELCIWRRSFGTCSPLPIDRSRCIFDEPITAVGEASHKTGTAEFAVNEDFLMSSGLCMQRIKDRLILYFNQFCFGQVTCSPACARFE
jgi:hypothetical protein